MSTFAFPSQNIGDFTITAISDGYLTASLSVLTNIDTTVASSMQDEAGVQEHSAIHINCYLVRNGNRTVLIDAGAGGFKHWGGCLSSNLPLTGVQASEIDAILLTHAHPDHIGGLLDASGEIMFPNAELIVHQREVTFWQDDANLSRANERARGNFGLARQVFNGYRSRLRTFVDGEVLPGISSMPIPGHTSGHSGYLFESAGQGLLVWGDVVHFPHIQIARPDVSVAFDQVPIFAARTRSRLLDLVSSERLLVAGMHFGEPGFARIKSIRGNYSICYET